MSLPKFHETMLPILRTLKHGKQQKTSLLPDQILDQGLLKLTPSELAEKTNKGDSLFHDRVWWGATYLRQGKYVHRPSRGLIQITQKGLDFIKKNPTDFTLSDLRKDKDFSSYVPTWSKTQENTENPQDLSPRDLIEKGYNELNESLRKNLLEKLREVDPYYFQNIILILFQKMGYGDFESTPKSGDGGIDGIINQDQLGIERIYIQAKRYKDGNKVREPDIRNFIGAMSGDVRKGVFVTTSSFDDLATQKAKNDRNHTLILIDGEKIVDLMIRYNVGVQVQSNYEVKSIDEDFFEVE